MKALIAKQYDKFLLVTALISISTVVFLDLSSNEQLSLNVAYLDDAFTLSRKSDGVTLKVNMENDLMPGEHIYFQGKDENFTKVEIEELFFKRRDEVTVLQKNGQSIVGNIKSKEGLKITKNWKKLSSPTLLDVDGKVRSLPTNSIQKIVGCPSYLLADSADLSYLEGKQPYFYQRKPDTYFLYNSRKSFEWENLGTDQNVSIYDLFTPPLIYLIDGVLTTTLPEAPVEEEEKEEFGVSLLGFNLKPYRFRLRSWIGASPYLEDIELTQQFGRTVRNRLDVNGVYKLADDPKPGRPSLIKVDEKDGEKLISLKYFTVQDVPQKNGGVKQVGRALIEDYQIGGKPFEINSLMNEVQLGQFEVVLSFKIKKEDPLEVRVKDSDVGREIIYNQRKYTVLSFDMEKKSLKIRKNAPIPTQSEDLELRMP